MQSFCANLLFLFIFVVAVLAYADDLRSLGAHHFLAAYSPLLDLNEGHHLSLDQYSGLSKPDYQHFAHSLHRVALGFDYLVHSWTLLSCCDHCDVEVVACPVSFGGYDYAKLRPDYDGHYNVVTSD